MLGCVAQAFWQYKKGHVEHRTEVLHNGLELHMHGLNLLRTEVFFSGFRSLFLALAG